MRGQSTENQKHTRPAPKYKLNVPTHLLTHATTDTVGFIGETKPNRLKTSPLIPSIVLERNPQLPALDIGRALPVPLHLQTSATLRSTFAQPSNRVLRTPAKTSFDAISMLYDDKPLDRGSRKKQFPSYANVPTKDVRMRQTEKKFVNTLLYGRQEVICYDLYTNMYVVKVNNSPMCSKIKGRKLLEEEALENGGKRGIQADRRAFNAYVQERVEQTQNELRQVMVEASEFRDAVLRKYENANPQPMARYPDSLLREVAMEAFSALKSNILTWHVIRRSPGLVNAAVKETKTALNESKQLYAKYVMLHKIAHNPLDPLFFSLKKVNPICTKDTTHRVFDIQSPIQRTGVIKVLSYSSPHISQSFKKPLLNVVQFITRELKRIKFTITGFFVPVRMIYTSGNKRIRLAALLLHIHRIMSRMRGFLHSLSVYITETYNEAYKCAAEEWCKSTMETNLAGGNSLSVSIWLKLEKVFLSARAQPLAEQSCDKDATNPSDVAVLLANSFSRHVKGLTYWLGSLLRNELYYTFSDFLELKQAIIYHVQMEFSALSKITRMASDELYALLIKPAELPHRIELDTAFINNYSETDNAIAILCHDLLDPITIDVMREGMPQPIENVKSFDGLYIDSYPPVEEALSSIGIQLPAYFKAFDELALDNFTFMGPMKIQIFQNHYETYNIKFDSNPETKAFAEKVLEESLTFDAQLNVKEGITLKELDLLILVLAKIRIKCISKTIEEEISPLKDLDELEPLPTLGEEQLTQEPPLLDISKIEQYAQQLQRHRQSFKRIMCITDQMASSLLKIDLCTVRSKCLSVITNRINQICDTLKTFTEQYVRMYWDAMNSFVTLLRREPVNYLDLKSILKARGEYEMYQNEWASQVENLIQLISNLTSKGILFDEPLCIYVGINSDASANSTDSGKQLLQSSTAMLEKLVEEFDERCVVYKKRFGGFEVDDERQGSNSDNLDVVEHESLEELRDMLSDPPFADVLQLPLQNKREYIRMCLCQTVKMKGGLRGLLKPYDGIETERLLESIRANCPEDETAHKLVESWLYAEKEGKIVAEELTSDNASYEHVAQTLHLVREMIVNDDFITALFYLVNTENGWNNNSISDNPTSRLLSLVLYILSTELTKLETRVESQNLYNAAKYLATTHPPVDAQLSKLNTKNNTILFRTFGIYMAARCLLSTTVKLDLVTSLSSRLIRNSYLIKPLTLLIEAQKHSHKNAGEHKTTDVSTLCSNIASMSFTEANELLQSTVLLELFRILNPIQDSELPKERTDYRQLMDADYDYDMRLYYNILLLINYVQNNKVLVEEYQKIKGSLENPTSKLREIVIKPSMPFEKEQWLVSPSVLQDLVFNLSSFVNELEFVKHMNGCNNAISVTMTGGEGEVKQNVNLINNNTNHSNISKLDVQLEKLISFASVLVNIEMGLDILQDFAESYSKYIPNIGSIANEIKQLSPQWLDLKQRLLQSKTNKQLLAGCDRDSHLSALVTFKNILYKSLNQLQRLWFQAASLSDAINKVIQSVENILLVQMIRKSEQTFRSICIKSLRERAKDYGMISFALLQEKLLELMEIQDPKELRNLKTNTRLVTNTHFNSFKELSETLDNPASANTAIISILKFSYTQFIWFAMYDGNITHVSQIYSALEELIQYINKESTTPPSIGVRDNIEHIISLVAINLKNVLRIQQLCKIMKGQNSVPLTFTPFLKIQNKLVAKIIPISSRAKPTTDTREYATFSIQMGPILRTYNDSMHTDIENMGNVINNDKNIEINRQISGLVALPLEKGVLISLLQHLNNGDVIKLLLPYKSTSSSCKVTRRTIKAMARICSRKLIIIRENEDIDSSMNKIISALSLGTWVIIRDLFGENWNYRTRLVTLINNIAMFPNTSGMNLSDVSTINTKIQIRLRGVNTAIPLNTGGALFCEIPTISYEGVKQIEMFDHSSIQGWCVNTCPVIQGIPEDLVQIVAKNPIAKFSSICCQQLKKDFREFMDFFYSVQKEAHLYEGLSEEDILTSENDRMDVTDIRTKELKKYDGFYLSQYGKQTTDNLIYFWPVIKKIGLMHVIFASVFDKHIIVNTKQGQRSNSHYHVRAEARYFFALLANKLGCELKYVDNMNQFTQELSHPAGRVLCPETRHHKLLVFDISSTEPNMVKQIYASLAEKRINIRGKEYDLSGCMCFVVGTCNINTEEMGPKYPELRITKPLLILSKQSCDVRHIFKTRTNKLIEDTIDAEGGLDYFITYLNTMIFEGLRVFTKHELKEKPTMPLVSLLDTIILTRVFISLVILFGQLNKLNTIKTEHDQLQIGFHCCSIRLWLVCVLNAIKTLSASDELVITSSIRDSIFDKLVKPETEEKQEFFDFHRPDIPQVESPLQLFLIETDGTHEDTIAETLHIRGLDETSFSLLDSTLITYFGINKEAQQSITEQERSGLLLEFIDKMKSRLFTKIKDGYIIDDLFHSLFSNPNKLTAVVKAGHYQIFDMKKYNLQKGRREHVSAFQDLTNIIFNHPIFVRTALIMASCVLVGISKTVVPMNKSYHKGLVGGSINAILSLCNQILDNMIQQISFPFDATTVQLRPHIHQEHAEMEKIIYASSNNEGLYNPNFDLNQTRLLEAVIERYCTLTPEGTICANGQKILHIVMQNSSILTQENLACCDNVGAKCLSVNRIPSLLIDKYSSPHLSERHFIETRNTNLTLVNILAPSSMILVSPVLTPEIMSSIFKTYLRMRKTGAIVYVQQTILDRKRIGKHAVKIQAMTEDNLADVVDYVVLILFEEPKDHMLFSKLEALAEDIFSQRLHQNIVAVCNMILARKAQMPGATSTGLLTVKEISRTYKSTLDKDNPDISSLKSILEYDRDAYYYLTGTKVFHEYFSSNVVAYSSSLDPNIALDTQILTGSESKDNSVGGLVNTSIFVNKPLVRFIGITLAELRSIKEFEMRNNVEVLIDPALSFDKLYSVLPKPTSPGPLTQFTTDWSIYDLLRTGIYKCCGLVPSRMIDNKVRQHKSATTTSYLHTKFSFSPFNDGSVASKRIVIIFSRESLTPAVCHVLNQLAVGCFENVLPPCEERNLIKTYCQHYSLYNTAPAFSLFRALIMRNLFVYILGDNQLREYKTFSPLNVKTPLVNTYLEYMPGVKPTSDSSMGLLKDGVRDPHSITFDELVHYVENFDSMCHTQVVGFNSTDLVIDVLKRFGFEQSVDKSRNNVLARRNVRAILFNYLRFYMYFMHQIEFFSKVILLCINVAMNNFELFREAFPEESRCFVPVVFKLLEKLASFVENFYKSRDNSVHIMSLIGISMIEFPSDEDALKYPELVISVNDKLSIENKTRSLSSQTACVLNPFNKFMKLSLIADIFYNSQAMRAQYMQAVIENEKSSPFVGFIDETEKSEDAQGITVADYDNLTDSYYNKPHITPIPSVLKSIHSTPQCTSIKRTQMFIASILLDLGNILVSEETMLPAKNIGIGEIESTIIQLKPQEQKTFKNEIQSASNSVMSQYNNDELYKYEQNNSLCITIDCSVPHDSAELTQIRQLMKAVLLKQNISLTVLLTNKNVGTFSKDLLIGGLEFMDLQSRVTRFKLLSENAYAQNISNLVDLYSIEMKYSKRPDAGFTGISMRQRSRQEGFIKTLLYLNAFTVAVEMKTRSLRNLIDKDYALISLVTRQYMTVNMKSDTTRGLKKKRVKESETISLQDTCDISESTGPLTTRSLLDYGKHENTITPLSVIRYTTKDKDELHDIFQLIHMKFISMSQEKSDYALCPPQEDITEVQAIGLANLNKLNSSIDTYGKHTQNLKPIHEQLCLYQKFLTFVQYLSSRLCYICRHLNLDENSFTFLSTASIIERSVKTKAHVGLLEANLLTDNEKELALLRAYDIVTYRTFRLVRKVLPECSTDIIFIAMFNIDEYHKVVTDSHSLLQQVSRKEFYDALTSFSGSENVSLEHIKELVSKAREQIKRDARTDCNGSLISNAHKLSVFEALVSECVDMINARDNELLNEAQFLLNGGPSKLLYFIIMFGGEPTKTDIKDALESINVFSTDNTKLDVSKNQEPMSQYYLNKYTQVANNYITFISFKETDVHRLLKTETTHKLRNQLVKVSQLQRIQRNEMSSKRDEALPVSILTENKRFHDTKSKIFGFKNTETNVLLVLTDRDYVEYQELHMLLLTCGKTLRSPNIMYARGVVEEYKALFAEGKATSLSIDYRQLSKDKTSNQTQQAKERNMNIFLLEGLEDKNDMRLFQRLLLLNYDKRTELNILLAPIVHPGVPYLLSLPVLSCASVMRLKRPVSLKDGLFRAVFGFVYFNSHSKFQSIFSAEELKALIVSDAISSYLQQERHHVYLSLYKLIAVISTSIPDIPSQVDKQRRVTDGIPAPLESTVPVKTKQYTNTKAINVPGTFILLNEGRDIFKPDETGARSVKYFYSCRASLTDTLRYLTSNEKDIDHLSQAITNPLGSLSHDEQKCFNINVKTTEPNEFDPLEIYMAIVANLNKVSHTFSTVSVLEVIRPEILALRDSVDMYGENRPLTAETLKAYRSEIAVRTSRSIDNLKFVISPIELDFTLFKIRCKATGPAERLRDVFQFGSKGNQTVFDAYITMSTSSRLERITVDNIPDLSFWLDRNIIGLRLTIL